MGSTPLFEERSFEKAEAGYVVRAEKNSSEKPSLAVLRAVAGRTE